MKLQSLIALTVLLCGQACAASHFYALSGKGGKGKGGKGKGGGKSKVPAFDCSEACFRVTDLVTSTSIQVEAIETAQDVSTFYGYSTDVHASFSGAMDTFRDESMIMMHKDTTKGDECNVTIIIVHDAAAGLTATGPNNYVNLTFSGDLSNAVVKDDPLECIVCDAEGDATTISWTWAPCCTDGLAHTYTLGENECITMTPDFVCGVDSWVFVSGPDPIGATCNGLNLKNPIEICRVPCDSWASWSFRESPWSFCKLHCI